jgi:predicted HTH transcriptional regulator
MQDPAKSFENLHRSTLKALEFLSFFDLENHKLNGFLQLIEKGESYNLEFKSTLRWDLYQNKKNSAMEHASLKTIAAFLNSSGGVLMIGVRDDGSIEGIETDKFENEDKFLLHLWNLIKSSMGQGVSAYVQTTLETINGRTVCQIKCTRSPSPVFLNQKGFGEEFYIRTGPSSNTLEIREALKYISERFEEK